ncbi:MAG: hypothetical protein JRG80_12945, partial [Deltaproteobacteria bacterium]|nr:hypothetical protein [Deltaproteobacteria bacterium]
EVVDTAAEQPVAYAASHEISLVIRRGEGVGNGADGIGDLAESVGVR